MDGQRRIAQSVRQFARSRAAAKVQVFGQSRAVGVWARGGAVAVLGAALFLGLVDGGHLGNRDAGSRDFNDKLSAMMGFAAENISISGLNDHQPEQLLKVLGVAPGNSLIGFDADDAKGLLEGIDWVEKASVQRKFPNQLEIIVTERQPFAVWQRGKFHYVIDRHGVAMSGVPSHRVAQLPLVSGEGANEKASELYADLSLVPEMHIRVNGAARVGLRRWTLYLDNGIKILLPESGVAPALQQLAKVEQTYGLFGKAVSEIDLRNPSQLRVALVPPASAADVPTGSIE